MVCGGAARYARALETGLLAFESAPLFTMRSRTGSERLSLARIK